MVIKNWEAHREKDTLNDRSGLAIFDGFSCQNFTIISPTIFWQLIIVLKGSLHAGYDTGTIQHGYKNTTNFLKLRIQHI